jgi:hypothetical protein
MSTIRLIHFPTRRHHTIQHNSYDKSFPYPAMLAAVSNRADLNKRGQYHHFRDDGQCPVPSECTQGMHVWAINTLKRIYSGELVPAERSVTVAFLESLGESRHCVVSVRLSMRMYISDLTVHMC